MANDGLSPIWRSDRTLFHKTRRKWPRLYAAHIALTVLLGACVWPDSPASAFSNRCANAENAPDPAVESPEKLRIFEVWKNLHGPGLDGGDGPLGCPIGTTEDFSGPPDTFTGLGQRFQRGWIFAGRGAAAGRQVAAIRGLDNWTVWTNGFDGILRNNADFAADIDHYPDSLVAASPAFGGTVVTFPKSGSLILFRCDERNPTDFILTGCLQIAPILNDLAGPFDFAARLNLDLLATPSRNARQLRTDAAISDWLPCFTKSPAVDSEAGEDTVTHASVMLRRDFACPLTNIVPREVVKTWLATLALPAGQVPGTSFDEVSVLGGTLCSERRGELDVLLVQLLTIRFRFQSELQGAALAGLETAIAPWGGSPRPWPYIAPGGFCAGRALIETENHVLLQETARYLVNAVKGEANGANREWLLRFMQQLVRRDFYEFNALPYTRYQTKALFGLAYHAPDDTVRVAARGVLDWLFAKLATSSNLAREQRPYRRRPDDSILSEMAWWSSAMNATTIAASLFVGPVQHASSDLDLQLDRPEGDRAFADVKAYPSLGTASEFFGAALLDAANTNYTLPEALGGWFERRFADDAANRLTYLQAFHHHSAIADDPSLFLQENSGSEIVSGNRNWTIIGGGSYAKPGYLPTPPSNDTGVIDLLTDAMANKKQLDKLWEDQPGMLRETMLLTSPVGLNRQQTLRFGGTEVSNRDRGGQGNRLCVAEGFLCGFDLRMPARPFPDSDAANCPVKTPLPPNLIAAFQTYAGTGPSITEQLGCLMKKPGLWSSSWRIWTFARGMLALPTSPGSTSFMGAWVEGRNPGHNGRLRVVWDTPWSADWFRVHAYARYVSPRGGEPPGGWIEPLAVAGDAGDRTKDNKGDVSYDIANVAVGASWDMLIVGCQKEYALGVLTGHDCRDDVLPKLTVSVGPEPAQSFSCKTHPPPPTSPALFVPPSEGIVLEVGSCTNGPYGLFVYIWNDACPSLNLSVSNSPGTSPCPFGVIDFGFAVVAPSRGWSANDFRAKVEASMIRWRADGNDYKPRRPASIDVPISPPVARTADGWSATGLSSQHTVTFQWSPNADGATITADSAAAGLFGPGGITSDPDQWPTARGHVSAPDAPGSGASLITSSGSGCITVAGVATAGDPDPIGLLIDMRDAFNPVRSDLRTSDLAARCN